MKKIVFLKHLLFLLILAVATAGCNRDNENEEIVEKEFCLCVNVENIDQIIPIINEFLNGLSYDKYFMWQLQDLVSWLKSHPCIIDAAVYSQLHTQPAPVYQISLSFEENETTKRLFIDVSNEIPLKVVGYRVYDPTEDKFCLYLNTANINQAIPIMNEFLSKQSNGLNEEQQLQGLVSWLKTHPCIVYAAVLTQSGNQNTPMKKVAVSFDINETTKNFILDVSTTRPLKITDHSEDIGVNTRPQVFDKTSSWTEITTYQNFYIEVRHFKLEGDTTINDLQYTKLYLNGNLLAAVREAENRVYAYFYNNKYEILAYDFNYRIGKTIYYELYNRPTNDDYNYALMHRDSMYITTLDSLLLYEDNFFFKDNLYLVALDSVLLLDGNYYKTIDGHVIQNIGATCGFFIHSSWFIQSWHYNLLCFSRNGKLVYRNNNFKNCYSCEEKKSVIKNSYINYKILNEKIRFKRNFFTKNKIIMP